MSQIIESLVLNHIIHLNPKLNPYQATADYVATFLLPCPLPSWSRYVQILETAELMIMFLQSAYILYLRSKTKKMYHIGLNSLGLIRLDRANHCGLCYFLYSIIAVAEIVCNELARSGHLDEGWPNFLLGVKFTIAIACAGVILWLCICHFAFVKQRAISGSMTPNRKVLSTTATRSLNIFLVIIMFVPTVTIVAVFSQLTLQYFYARQVVMPVIQHLWDLAPTCTPGTCSITYVASQALVLTRALHHIDLMVHHTRVGLYIYMFFDASTALIYAPIVYTLFQSFKNGRGLDHTTKRQLDGVFSNTVIEFAILFLHFIVGVCATCLVKNGEFILNPNFWLILRIGIGSSIATLGNITLFLILDGLRRTDTTQSAPQIALPRFTTLTGLSLIHI